ncbi:hypothetical protein HK100_009033, partial [Physocladia obscura]
MIRTSLVSTTATNTVLYFSEITTTASFAQDTQDNTLLSISAIAIIAVAAVTLIALVACAVFGFRKKSSISQLPVAVAEIQTSGEATGDSRGKMASLARPNTAR